METMVVDIKQSKLASVCEENFRKLEDNARGLAQENFDSLLMSINNMPQFSAQVVVENFCHNIIGQVFKRYEKDEIVNLLSSGFVFDFKNMLEDEFLKLL